MKEYPVPSGLETTDPSCLVGFNDEDTKLQLIQVQDGNPVDHALSSGRIAFACKYVPPIYESVKAAGEFIQVPPLTLPTPGKADVVVTILQDRDGYEICFVEDVAFYDLATPKYDVIDFPARALRGGDGAPPPAVDAIEHGGEIIELTDAQEAEKIVGESKEKAVVLDFNAGWCKNCKKIAPVISKLAKQYAGTCTVYSVDIVSMEDIALAYDVSTLPRLLFFKNGAKVDDYLGSKEEDIVAK
jgi:thioredoxin 1